MSELSEDKERTTPLLNKTEKPRNGRSDGKLYYSVAATQSVSTQHPLDILSTMPPEVVQTIAKQLYNQEGEDNKIVPSKDVAKLKATSRHFYGETPSVPCLPNTKKYAAKSIRLFTCELGFELLDFDKRPDYRHPDDVNKAHDCCIATFICACCLPVSTSAGIVGSLIGCIMDTRNAISSARIKSNRPQESEHGYLSVPLSDSKPPSNQSMK